MHKYSTENKYHIRKLIKLSKCIELQLHKEAASFADYIDMSTLPQRIALVQSKLRVIHTMKSNEMINQLSDKFSHNCNFRDVLVKK